MLTSRKVFTSLIKLFSTVAVTFLLLELLLVVFDDQVFRSSFYVFDSEMGFRVRPYARYGAAQANEFGFNDRDYPHERRPGTYRILFLGDSFSWIGGPKNNYTALLERRFAETFGEDRVEVITAGYSMTHTGEQRVLLEKFGLQYAPDLVVLGFFAGNDFYDADPARFRVALGGSYTDVFLGRDFYQTVWGRPVVARSRISLYLKELWTNLSSPRARAMQDLAAEAPLRSGAMAEPPVPKSIPVVPLSPSPVLTEEYMTSLLLRTQFCDPQHFSGYRKHEQYVFDSLLRIQAVLDQRNIRFLLAAFPDEIQVDASVRDAFREKSNLDTSTWQWLRAQDLLARFSTQHQIEYFDLLPFFQSECGKGHRLYLPNDSHWNEAGNWLAADLFFQKLVMTVRAGLGEGGAEAEGP